MEGGTHAEREFTGGLTGCHMPSCVTTPTEPYIANS